MVINRTSFVVVFNKARLEEVKIFFRNISQITKNGVMIKLEQCEKIEKGLIKGRRRKAK